MKILVIEGSKPGLRKHWLREALLSAGATYLRTQEKMVLGDLTVFFKRLQPIERIAGLEFDKVVIDEAVQPDPYERGFLLSRERSSS